MTTPSRSNVARCPSSAQRRSLRHVARTNFCDVAVHRRGERVVVLTAIDNLGKGMAGQAIQNMNLLFDLEETAGLRAPGGNP